MKIYVHEKGIIIAGKSWEVRRKLREYSKEHKLVKDWIRSTNPDGRNICRQGNTPVQY
ncbi:Z-ring formation inhibitor MciZ [Mesobacillus harenae]|uniref:Z-ring formation inhibitor MciZ n=1 Tax=Mesobacillus harenae TaxID=2213203 RepID=UPI001580E5DC